MVPGVGVGLVDDQKLEIAEEAGPPPVVGKIDVEPDEVGDDHVRILPNVSSPVRRRVAVVDPDRSVDPHGLEEVVELGLLVPGESLGGIH